MSVPPATTTLSSVFSELLQMVMLGIHVYEKCAGWVGCNVRLRPRFLLCGLAVVYPGYLVFGGMLRGVADFCGLLLY